MKPVNGHNTIPYLKSLASCLKRIVSDGYTEDFKLENLKLASLSTRRLYQPQQVNIVNSFHFQGNADPSNSAFLYVIETSDGHKGTLVDHTGKLTPSIENFIHASTGDAKGK